MASFSCKIMALVLVLSLVSSSAELQKLEHSIKNDGSLSLLVIGDWGRKGEFNQSQVATQMGRIGEELDIDFVVSTGDNFYDSGLTGVDDKAFEESFTNNLDSALKESRATWKVVVGHHTIRSVSIHRDTKELLSSLLPILKTHGVDLYVNGHDHCLEHISSNESPIQYLTSGGGSKSWRGVFNSNTDKLRFFYDGQGFMSLQLTKTVAQVVFYDAFGSVLHKWSVTKELHSSM
ncbi:hypothetical protein C4D60_Mb10t05140 [Musa balbisiana]|uniref:Calcineurin-like phosphoesterase domain-containing protein n=1 Tax=Musa balbisiana TaxID=52838 RepID=A0A4S8IUS0_MUSBA|nr:hypothetical protein C4D60_Mb10t05140 [Musa balbisiana]